MVMYMFLGVYFSPLNCTRSEGIDFGVEKVLFFVGESVQFLEFIVCIPHLHTVVLDFW